MYSFVEYVRFDVIESDIVLTSPLEVEILDKFINAKNVDKNGSRLEAQVPNGFDKKNVPMKLGSGLLIHSRVVHSSNDNTSNSPRYSILYTFIRKGIKFNPGKYSKRVALEFC